MSEIFEYTEELKDQYPNIPEKELKALDGYRLATAIKVLKMLSSDKGNRWEYYKSIATEDDLDEILSLDDIQEIKENLEEKYGIKIYLEEKKDNSESNYNGYISIFKGTDLVGEIWTDLFNFGNDDYVDSHLGIEVYGEYQGKGFGKLLYKLYKRWSELDNSIFFPPEEYATKYSRMKLLLKMGYELDSVYEMGDFRSLTDEEIKQILEDLDENFYSEQYRIYKFIYKN